MGLLGSRDHALKLGWASTSPMFGRLGAPEETDSDASYSDMELVAMGQAVERLKAEHPDEWHALTVHLKPHLAAASACPALLAAAGQRLADWVDTAIDGAKW